MAQPGARGCAAASTSSSRASPDPWDSAATVPAPGKRGDTGRRKGLLEPPHCTCTPALPGLNPLGRRAGARERCCSPARSPPAPTAGTPGTLRHARASPKMPNSSGKGQEQRVDAKEERGRKDKRAKKSYQLESKQATEMIALKLFTPG